MTKRLTPGAQHLLDALDRVNEQIASVKRSPAYRYANQGHVSGWKLVLVKGELYVIPPEGVTGYPNPPGWRRT